MAVVGLGEEFAAGVLDGDEGPGVGSGVIRHPGDALVGGIVDAPVGAGEEFSSVGEKVAEGSAA